MSLKVWLPLNGDIKNYGASNLNPSLIGSPSYTDSGKIGKALYVSSDGQGVNLPSYMNTLSTFTKYSMSAWVYMTTTASNHSSSILSSGNWNSSSGQLCFGFYDYNSGYRKLLVPNRTHWADGITLSNPVQLNTWYHVCITYDDSVTKGYINGSYIGSYSGGGITPSSETSDLHVGRATYYEGFTIKGYVNDVRIYDHCLSVSDVKELSKGLVAHYPLNDAELESTTNLFGSKSENFSDWSSYGFGSSGVKSYPSMSPAVSGQVCQVTDGSSNTSNHAVEMATWATGPTLNNGEKVTLSAYVKGSKDTIGKTCFIHVYNSNGTNTQSNTVASCTLTANWQRISGQFTWTQSTASSTSFSNYVVCNMTTGQYFYFCNIQLEAKDHVTPYVNGTRSKLEAYDNSGYNRTGIIDSSATSAVAKDGARGEVSYKFDGVSNSIKIPFNSMIPPSGDGIFTMNVWIYHTSEWSSKTWETIFGGPGGFELQAKQSSTASPLLFAYSWGQSSAAYELNKWTMITMVRTTSDAKFYINGEHKFTGSAGSLPSGNYFIGAWNSYTQQNYKGLMSDFKLYATALSADDISQEYHTYASIYNNQTLKACEFIEPIAANLLEPTNTTLTRKTWGYGLSAYTQQNCNVTLTDNGYRIYRDPNLTYSGNGSVMWGGFVVKPYDVYGRDMLIKGHTYILKFHVKGQSSNGSEFYWTNQVGWGGGGLEPSPSDISYQMTGSNFQGEMECFYKWTINDDVWKVCTNSYSGFTAGNTYLSYRDFKYGFNYGDTGPLGTDLYITNIRMYDITAGNVPVKISTKGVCYGNMVEENFDKVSFNQGNEVFAKQFIEI